MTSKVTGEGDAAEVPKMSERQTKAFAKCFAFAFAKCFAKLEKFANLQKLQIDPWDMLNNFCFHVNAQKSLFIFENDNVYFWTSPVAAPYPVSSEFIDLVPS